MTKTIITIERADSGGPREISEKDIEFEFGTQVLRDLQASNIGDILWVDDSTALCKEEDEE